MTNLYGPGIFDMKASCVIALEALCCLDALKVAVGIFGGGTGGNEDE